jgi:hypothetical protein
VKNNFCCFEIVPVPVALLLPQQKKKKVSIDTAFNVGDRVYTIEKGVQYFGVIKAITKDSYKILHPRMNVLTLSKNFQVI